MKKRTRFLGAWLAVGLALLSRSPGQSLLSLEDGNRNIFSQQPSSQWPPPPPSIDEDPRVPTPHQFQNGTPFGGWLTTTIKDGTGAVLAGSTTTTAGPTTLILPSFQPLDTDGNAVANTGVKLESVQMARAISSRAATILFGGVIPRPTTDENGVPVNEQTYLPEPDNSSTGRYYYSQNARAVFGTQAGVVDVVWRFRDPAHVPQTLSIQYVVSSSPASPPKRMFWTEKGFNGPIVQVPQGPITAVNVVYNAQMPAQVGQEYDSPYDVAGDPAIALPAEKRTLWYSQTDRAFHAYNAEGRLFVEFLGALRADNVTREFLGSEVVEVIREVNGLPVVTMIGERILPHDGDTTLEGRIINGLVSSPPFVYQKASLKENKINFYAVRTTNQSASEPDKPTGEVLLYWMQPGVLGLKWPKYYETHIVRWPTDEAAFSTYVRGDQSDSDAASTAVTFDGDNSAALVFEDGSQAQVNNAVKFHTSLTTADPDNRSLIRHQNGDDVWFERVYSKLDTTENLAGATLEATVGQRIDPPAGLGLEAIVGYIHQNTGTGFDESAYKDPFVVGMASARTGAIIPVNALENHDMLEVWWFKKSAPPAGTALKPTYWPAAVRRYHVSWPASPDEIVLASNRGTGDLPSDQAAGSIYVQNDRRKVGFNPNEEHAMMIAGRAWAIRDDLNTPTSSEPYVLVRYTDATDGRPAIHPFFVLREKPESNLVFNYQADAGKILQAPMPLPILPLPMKDGQAQNFEMMETTSDPAPADGAPEIYNSFTFQDRKGTQWVYRGPHDSERTDATFKMKYHYVMMPGFFVPLEQPATTIGATAPADPQPAAGTILPYLRSFANNTDPSEGYVGEANDAEPLEIVFRPTWPASTPELRLAETLTLPKFGLPAVRGNTSMDILYQQSIAADIEVPSAILFDPTRAKKYILDPEEGLEKLPASVSTSDYRGKTYFPNLPPHLAERFYFDPNEGTDGALVLLGQFKDEVIGEDYLLLNVLSAEDTKAIKGLCTETGSAKSDWDEAIDALETTMETFEEDPQVAGTYIPSEANAVEPIWTWVGNFKFAERVSVVTGGWKSVYNYSQHRYVRTYQKTTTQKIVNHTPTKAQFFTGVQSGSINPTRIAAGWEWVQKNISRLQGWQVAKLTNQSSAEEKGNKLKAELTEDTKGQATIGPDALAVVTDSDTAVDSYALNASGGGTGYVVLISGNGRAFTPADEPVAMHVIKVSNPLYRGELKPIEPTNPLAEKLTMQHTGDFAGEPANYEFEWRYAPPVDGLSPVLYTFERTELLGDGVWSQIPSGGVPTSVTLPGPVLINNGQAASGSPQSVLKRSFTVTQRPFRSFISLTLGANDGVRAFVNEAQVAAYRYSGETNSPTTRAPLPTFNSLPLLFEIPVGALREGENVIRLELTTTADVGVSPASVLNVRLESMNETEHLASWIPAGVGVGETPGDMPGSVRGKNRFVIQGPGIFTLTDNYFIMRYRAKNEDDAAYVANGGWSKWTDPALAEGWIKRALKGINPFEQRIKDLFNNAVNTDVSLITQAGKRWEGDIALNLENINQFGLIEIYETILRRGKALSIEGTPPINYGPANDALILAAGYLNDLYVLLGNEAYADAANPTIAFSTDGGQYGDIATSLFAFKGQVGTVLDEELSLLRGRDDFLAPGVRTSPIYNRLVWNYTRGIDSGEAIYALNYNLKDTNADGVVNAADAAIAYPQGHGDAYGQYLTALTGYYGLLSNSNFEWTPRTEAVNILGKAVSVDYLDERKFAAAAASLTRVAAQTLDLTYKNAYQVAPNGWSHLKDGRVNPQTGNTRSWGVDDWACRAGQGAYLHWLTANSTLPAVDPNPAHEGIQKIDRTTVPELAEIVSQNEKIKATLSLADSRLNPLGLSAGAVPFDISPSQVDAGRTHFEQIYDRAVESLRNAVTAFNNAKSSTQILRRQEDSLSELRLAIGDQERTFTKQLIDLYGTPYAGDVGPGKSYVQGYTGPDYFHHMYIDTPELFKNTPAEEEETETFTLRLGTDYTQIDLSDKKWSSDNPDETPTAGLGEEIPYDLTSLGEFRKPKTLTGVRAHPGRLQQALSERMMARLKLHNALEDYAEIGVQFKRLAKQYESARYAARTTIDLQYAQAAADRALGLATGILDTVIDIVGEAKEAVETTTEIALEGIPKVVGLATDATAPVRGTMKTVSEAVEGLSEAAVKSMKKAKFVMEQINAFLTTANEIAASELAWGVEHKQMLLDLQAAFEEFEDGTRTIDAALRSADDATRKYRAMLDEGVQIQAEREIFRQKSAALIQGYRTQDLGFRVFRNEALESYKSLFDLSARYSFLAARAYDYETGLADAGGNTRAADFFQKIVRARAVGVFGDNRPQPAGSTLGDPGLSGVLAQMNSDWSVVKTRLGFNNPDRYRTTFSLRQEKERIVPSTAGDVAWADALAATKMDNILEDDDVRRYCMQINSSGALAVPGFVIPFQTTISDGVNFFGQALAGGDSTFTPTSFATKIRSTGIAFKGYVGMASPTSVGGTVSGSGGTTPADPDLGFLDPNALSATPYVYLIAAGADSMRSPALGDSSIVRSWQVEDQAIPLPFDIGGAALTSSTFTTDQSLTEPFTIRKHQAFRAVPDGTVFSSTPGFTNSRLIGRSVWNSRWKIVIPAKTLLADPVKGMQIFQQTVKDIKLHLETYSYSGN